MKKSEILRQAVYTRLVPHMKTWYHKKDSIGLSHALVKTDFSLYVELGVILSEADNQFWNTPEEFHQIQCIKFMFAEFLALMYEDEEREEIPENE